MAVFLAVPALMISKSKRVFFPFLPNFAACRIGRHAAQHMVHTRSAKERVISTSVEQEYSGNKGVDNCVERWALLYYLLCPWKPGESPKFESFNTCDILHPSNTLLLIIFESHAKAAPTHHAARLMPADEIIKKVITRVFNPFRHLIGSL